MLKKRRRPRRLRRNILKIEKNMEKKCKICLSKFRTFPFKLRDGNGKFCSRICYAESLRKKKLKITCKNCKNIFETHPSRKKYKRKFCDKECFQKYIKKNHPWNFKGYHKMKCANGKCRKEFISGAARALNKKYCSMQCQWDCRKEFSGDKSASWRGGVSFKPYSHNFNTSLKFMIRERFNFHCVECGRIENGRKLHIHHVDFNKKNNRLNNFFPLCISCHSLTVHFPSIYIPYFKEKMKLFNSFHLKG